MITTNELARLAGVSQSTVSRSLNDSPEISRETREMIRNLARQNGYIIKKHKRKTIATANRKAIAVIIAGREYTNHYHQALFIPIFDRIEEENYFAIHINAHREVDTRRVEDLISIGMLSGVIIINRHFNPVVSDYLYRLGTPHIYLHYFGKDSLEAFDVVDTDNYYGGYIATKHLLDLGHRRIKVISSLDEYDCHPFADRTTGFMSAMWEAGLTVGEDIAHIDYNYTAAYSYVASNLAQIRKNYTAIFAHNDAMGVGCVNALQDNGLRVPEDISVVGYDGIGEGEFCRPALTSVYQPVEELAAATVARLLTLIEATEKTRAMRTFIQPSLLLRDSTGAPPRKKK